MKMNKAFAKHLHKLMKDTSHKTNKNMDELRPFVCDGNPLDCEIFLIGINPASNVNWKSFWDKSTGLFNKKDWFVKYKKMRIEKKLKKGKQKSLSVSTTRKRIEFFINEISAYRCLETNIYSVPSKKISDLKEIEKNSILFDFLINSIKPKILFLHGEPTIDYFQDKYNLKIIKEKPKNYNLGYGDVTIFGKQHFASRKKGMTDSLVKEWGKEVKLEAEKVLV